MAKWYHRQMETADVEPTRERLRCNHNVRRFARGGVGRGVNTQVLDHRAAHGGKHVMEHGPTAPKLVRPCIRMPPR